MIIRDTPDPNKPLVSWIRYSIEPEEKKTMTAKCPTCNSELPDNHPALTLQSLLNYIENSGGWYIFNSYSVGDKVSKFDDVEIAAIKTMYETGDVDVESYYGESALPQGSEFETYIVFKVGEFFYKKTGRGDSYGEVEWDGDIKQVEAVAKTIWEFK